MTTPIPSTANDPRLPGVEHPGELQSRLIARIQGEGVQLFADVQDEWLRIMWAIDAYRVAGLCPPQMGKPQLTESARLDGVYRSKGNWFKDILSVLLQNRTSQPVKARVNVQGFSQFHQVDLAWPERELNPLVCVEAKVTGGPAYGTKSSRGALADFSNRRKELKFAATDLKLFIRQHNTEIRHWGLWKDQESPTAYFLWGARLRTGKRPEDIRKLILEVQYLVRTYLNGAGLFAWMENGSGDGYQAIPIPFADQVSSLDDVLHRIASEIRSHAPTGIPPAPVVPSERTVDLRRISKDKGSD